MGINPAMEGLGNPGQIMNMDRFKLRPIVLFNLLEFGLAWPFSLHLSMHGGLRNQRFSIIGIAAMRTPAVAAVIVSKVVVVGPTPAAAAGLIAFSSTSRRPWGRSRRANGFSR